MKNIELKVKLNSFIGITTFLRKFGAELKSKLNQIDTYYKSSNGRVKIREINKKEFELIFYLRSNKKISKISNYQIIKIQKKQLPEIKSLFRKAFGQQVIVRKTRIYWLYRNTRIHLDTVSGLGKFLELETLVLENYPLAKKEHQAVIRILKLAKYKRCGESYSDLLCKK